MKKLCVSLVVILLLTASSRIEAEPQKASEDTEEVFQTKRLWHFSAMPAWWFAWLATHEGSHALAAKYWDWDVMDIKPYPHFSDAAGTQPRRFYWGTTLLRCEEKTGLHLENGRYVDGPYWPACAYGGGLSAIYLAPYVVNTSVFMIADIVLTYHLDLDTTTGAIVFMGGMVGPWVNSLFGSNFLTGGPDLAVFSERTGTPAWATTLTFDALMTLGAWRLYVHGKDLLFDSSRKKEKKHPWLVMPMMGTGPGLSLSLQF